jgi:hypothetical protein
MKRSKIRTAETFFKRFREFMADRTVRLDEQVDVWDVMTALRGPDDQDWQVKNATTAVIRDTLMRGNTHLWYTSFPDLPDFVEVRRGEEMSSEPHFYCHAQSAFRALGLEWDKLNKQKR